MREKHFVEQMRRGAVSTNSGTAGDALIKDHVPKLFIDRDFVIRAVNPAFARATGQPADALISRLPFDVFPNNPDDPSADGVERLRASFEWVARTGSMHNMVIQRYDIPDPRNAHSFVRRYWVPVNTPVVEDGQVIGIVHQVKDVSILRSNILTAMEHYREMLLSAAPRALEAEAHSYMVDAFTEGATHINALEQEVAQLREALDSRGTIEQAKGMLMLSRQCTAEEAFTILRELSQNTNVRLVDVAAALIYQLKGSKAESDRADPPN